MPAPHRSTGVRQPRQGRPMDGFEAAATTRCTNPDCPCQTNPNMRPLQLSTSATSSGNLPARW